MQTEQHTLRWRLSLEDGRVIAVETRDLLDRHDYCDATFVDGAIAKVSWSDPVAWTRGIVLECECRRMGDFPDRIVDHRAAVVRLADANGWNVKGIEVAP